MEDGEGIAGEFHRSKACGQRGLGRHRAQPRKAEMAQWLDSATPGDLHLVAIANDQHLMPDRRLPSDQFNDHAECAGADASIGSAQPWFNEMKNPHRRMIPAAPHTASTLREIPHARESSPRRQIAAKVARLVLVEQLGDDHAGLLGQVLHQFAAAGGIAEFVVVDHPKRGLDGP